MKEVMSNTTTNGSLVFCENCCKYQLVYKNIYLKFTESEFKHYQKYLSKVYFGVESSKCPIPKRLRVATLNSPHSMYLSKDELAELYRLSCCCSRFVFFNARFKFSLN